MAYIGTEPLADRYSGTDGQPIRYKGHDVRPFYRCQVTRDTVLNVSVKRCSFWIRQALCFAVETGYIVSRTSKDKKAIIWIETCPDRFSLKFSSRSKSPFQLDIYNAWNSYGSVDMWMGNYGVISEKTGGMTSLRFSHGMFLPNFSNLIVDITLGDA